MQITRNRISRMIVESEERNALLRDVDDILDDVIMDAAPELVQMIREREVDEDIDEFIDGAIHGGWDARTQDYADPPAVGDDDATLEGETTEMYVLGYEWGWEHPQKAKDKNIPSVTKAEMVEYALENFSSRITEEFVIDALEKAVGYAKEQVHDIHSIIKKAQERWGWKIAPAIAGIEVLEHAIVPTVLGAIHPAFYALAAVPTLEILAASALAIAKARMPKKEKEELPPGHLDWYEDEGRKKAVGENMKIKRSQLRRLIREALLNEEKEGYMVPRFETTEDMMLFLDELEPEDTTMHDVVDPETGEVWLEAGYTPLEIGLVELEEEEQPEETDPDELDHYDWDALDREDEEREKAEEEEYERVVKKVQEDGVQAGKDWAMDTMSDAIHDPSMWQDQGYGQWGSPEDYVSGVGQDVTADVADALLTYSDDEGVIDMYRSLPTEERMGGYYRDSYTDRPSRQIMKDIVADSVYDGIMQGIEEYKEKRPEEVLPWTDLGASA